MCVNTSVCLALDYAKIVQITHILKMTLYDKLRLIMIHKQNVNNSE